MYKTESQRGEVNCPQSKKETEKKKPSVWLCENTDMDDLTSKFDLYYLTIIPIRHICFMQDLIYSIKILLCSDHVLGTELGVEEIK